MLLTANTTRFEFEVAGSPDELHVVAFTLNESLSHLFQADIQIAVENPEIAFEEMIAKPGALTIIGEEESRYFQGIVSRFEQISVGDRFSTYHAVIVPAIWYLGHRHNSRIFQNKSAKEIINQILDELGLPTDQYRWVLNSEPPKRDYCVQYRESELNFMQRLLEEEGIYYFFEHDNSKHILVLGDSPAAHIPILGDPTVNYHEARPDQVPDEEFVFNFRYREEIRPGKVTLKDYNFRKPSLNLKGERQGDRNDELEVYDYPAEFEDPDRGKVLAKVRLEEQQSVRKIGSAATVTNRMIAGGFFTLAEHPRDSFNKKYLITELHTSGQQPQVFEELSGDGSSSFSVNLQFIPFETPYRPARTTPKPVVEGSQTAIIVGPGDEEIYTDEYGCVKVQFHWDREGQMDENSSCWIRVSQAWAGTGWGSMVIPRIGHEVIVDFIEGDPDRPIITGRVYHGTSRPPYPLPGEKTKSTMKSNSSKGGGGFNEIRFEDKKGSEQLFFHAEKDYDLRVKKDRREYVGQDQDVQIKRDAKALIEGKKNLIIKDDNRTHVSGDHYFETKKELHEQVGKSYYNKTSMEVHVKSGKKIVIDAGMDITLKAGGSFIRLNSSGVTIKGSKVKINSGGSPAKVKNAKSQQPSKAKEADDAKPGQQAAQRAALKAAARKGVPFCAVC